MSLKFFIAIGLALLVQQQVAATAADGVFDQEPETYSKATINDYTDRLLSLVRPAIVKNGFDPFKIDDISRDFWFKVLLVNYTGHIDLKNGWLQDLSTIRRLGDTKLKYEKKILTLDLMLVVDCLTANLDHTIKIFDIGPSGLLSATIKKQQIRFAILVDFERITFHLQQFALLNSDQVKIRLTGLGLADPLVNIIVDSLTAVFKNSITTAIGKQIRTAIEEILEKLPPLLPPAPPTKEEELFALLDLVMRSLPLANPMDKANLLVEYDSEG